MASVSRLTMLKFTELVLVVACVILHYNSFNESTGKLFLMSGTFGGYLIIMVGVFMGFFVDTTVGRRTDLYFTLLGGILFLACGIIAYGRHSGGGMKDEGFLKAWAAIIAGIVFIVDAVFTFRTE